MYLPSLFGRRSPGEWPGDRAIDLRVCVAREFTTLADRTSPVVGWLRALAASAYRECGGPGSAWSGCASPEVSRWRQRSNRRSSRPSSASRPCPRRSGGVAVPPWAWMLRISAQSRLERMTACACSGSGSPTGVARASDSRPCGRRSGHPSRASRSTLRLVTRLASRRRRTRCSRTLSSTSRGIRPGWPLDRVLAFLAEQLRH